jgi:hypothetical protein
MMTRELFSPWLQAFAWHGTTASEQLHGKHELVASANRLAPWMDARPVAREQAPPPVRCD